MTYNTPFKIVRHEYVGRSWSRYDIDAKGNKKHYFAAGPDDSSPHHDIRRHYDAECSCCRLGFGHTEEAHKARIARVDADQDVRRSYVGNL